MRGRVAGKRALVTGAAQGIGAATALMLARHGATVLATDINLEGAEATAAAINEEIGSPVSFAMKHDVSVEQDWIAAVKGASDMLGGLSVLVNNAGVVLTGTIEDFSLEEWHRGMAINSDSVFLGCKHALGLMKHGGPGSIVNVSSISALIASPSFANYNASKAAVWMLTKSIALHCAGHGWDIRCNSVHPAFIRTPILDDLGRGKDPDVVTDKLVRQIPLGRLGEAEDVAHAVLYLASDESRFMTGAELKLDGGISAM